MARTKPTFTVEVVNKKGFAKRMAKRIAGLEIQGKALEKGIAEEIATVAKEFVAVDTGKTKRNIRAEQRGGDWVVVSDRGGDRPEVAVILEFGSVHQAAQPYMVPAADVVLARGGIDNVVRGVGGLLIT